MIFIWLHRWTDIELKRVISMLRNPEFDAKDVDPDLHKRMKKNVDAAGKRLFGSEANAGAAFQIGQLRYRP